MFWPVLPLDLCAEMDQDFKTLVRWNKGIDCTGLDLVLSRLLDQGEIQQIPCTLDLTPKTSCSYYTDGSKQRSSTVGTGFLAVVEGQVLKEKQFHFSDSAEVFVAEVHVIKETITDAHLSGLGELDVYSDSRSALQVLNGLSQSTELSPRLRTWLNK